MIEILGKKYFTTEEAAEKLDNITARTLNRWAAAGEGPPRLPMPGGNLYYPEDGLLTWLESRVELKEGA